MSNDYYLNIVCMYMLIDLNLYRIEFFRDLLYIIF